MTIIYGIKNCDTMKKALRWLDENQIAYRFHDYRKDGLERELLQQWLDQEGWENLVNKRGTTWRKLDSAEQEDMPNRAVELFQQHPAMIKRPLLVHENQITLGFKAEIYQALFQINK
ncbi:ArsC family reductase [Maribrevibacterium harenarium]|uniref:ArsC family reductase n=1 Tax=Maribrevibacterium harenarium TaxID=2589817 RepID=A0A501X0Y3_9GAMM|nr:ArsC family reductase [Maribrevibacterium harenarium]TPE52836.1 ArsC family reductase [Maribrevibacterium harenarium]